MEARAEAAGVSADAWAGFVLSFFGLVPVFGFLFGLFGLVCSAVAVSRGSGGRRLAVAGMTLGITFLFLQVVVSGFLLSCFGCRVHG